MKRRVMKRAHKLYKANPAGWTFADALHTSWLIEKEIEEEY